MFYINCKQHEESEKIVKCFLLDKRKMVGLSFSNKNRFFIGKAFRENFAFGCGNSMDLTLIFRYIDVKFNCGRF
jgi:hypothetical protein